MRRSRRGRILSSQITDRHEFIGDLDDSLAVRKNAMPEILTEEQTALYEGQLEGFRQLITTMRKAGATQ